MEQNIKLKIDIDTLLEDLAVYQCLISQFIYLIVTRPDIAHSVNILSQFMHAPCQPQLDVAHRLLRYLKATIGQWLFYLAKHELQLMTYCDSDWACCLITRRTTIGYFILLSDSPILGKPRNKT